MQQQGEQYVIGCDVGTGSVRAGLISTRDGHMSASFTQPIKLFEQVVGHHVHLEQSSSDIWASCCHVIRKCIDSLGTSGADLVVAIAFDATCSLVVTSKSGKKVSISTSGETERDVILWACHRATPQALRINSTKHAVLNSVGGIISPEMEVPKLLWIKENLPDLWSQLDDLLFFDLADYLVYKCTDDIHIRSENTVACKWTYQANDLGSVKKGWQSDFFELIGLSELVENGYQQIGTDIKPVGTPVGNGVTQQAEIDTGLKKGTTVAVSIIDAHAGGVGILGSNLDNIDDACTRLALISGTSSCHMAMSKSAVLVNGVWGPFYNAMVPGYWVNEGGQSASGRLIDHVISSHSYYPTIIKECDQSHSKLYTILHQKLIEMQGSSGNYSILTKDIHVLDYFHGNRSPHADPTALGAISGLTIASTLENLALVYLATVQAIAYGTRHIIEAINEERKRSNEKPISQIYICGGLGKNSLFVEQNAHICGCEVVVAEDVEAMILGSAILAFKAYSSETDFATIMRRLSGKTLTTIQPTGDSELIQYHNNKYQVYHLLYKHQKEYASIMSQ